MGDTIAIHREAGPGGTVENARPARRAFRALDAVRPGGLGSDNDPVAGSAVRNPAGSVAFHGRLPHAGAPIRRTDGEA